MKRKLTQLAALSATMLAPFISTAQEPSDSISSAGKGEERNVMLKDRKSVV